MLSNHSAVTESPAHAWFLSHLPEINSRARACLSRLRPDEQEEAIAEVVGSVFKAGIFAARRGTLHRVTPYYAVVYACRQYRQGRRLAGYSSRDVTSEAAHARGRAKVVSLSSLPRARRERGEEKGAATLADMLADGRGYYSPFEQARLNLDYPAVLEAERISPKARRVFGMLSAIRGRGHVAEIAKALGVSAGRVCHLKAQLARALARHDYAYPA